MVKSKTTKGKAHGGKRPGAGRKKGTLNAETLDRMKVNEELRQRTMRVAGKLFESQLTLAQGQTFLFRIDKVWVSTKGGKAGFWKSKKPVIETNPETIAAFLEGEMDGRDEENGGASYYFITTKEPHASAIDSMLDRALGGAPKALEITNPDGSLKQVVIIKNATEKKNVKDG